MDFESSTGSFSNPRDVDLREANITSPVSVSSISMSEEISNVTIENQSIDITMEAGATLYR